MRHKTKHLFLTGLLLSFSLTSLAQQKDVVCNFSLEYEYFPDLYPQLIKTCADFDQATESCSSFSFHAKKSPKKYALTDATAGIQKENGILTFKPVTLSSFEERENGVIARRWMLEFIDNSGSPTRAEERFIVIDGAFKPMTKLMSFVEKNTYLKSRKNLATQPSSDQMSCKHSSAKK